MSDLGNKEIMSKNIQRYMHQKGVSRTQLANDLNVKYTTLTDWVKGNTYPRIDKIEMMANYFGITKADLVEKPHKENKAAETIAAHIDDDTPEEERQQIINFIENLKKARKQVVYVNNFEKLAASRPNLLIQQRKDMPKDLGGYVYNNEIGIDSNRNLQEQYEILQEEIAHYDTSVGDITDYDDHQSMKQEKLARSVAMERTVNLDGLIHCFYAGLWSLVDVADYFGVTTKYVLAAINNYRVKRGLVFRYKNYYFDFRRTINITKIK